MIKLFSMALTSVNDRLYIAGMKRVGLGLIRQTTDERDYKYKIIGTTKAESDLRDKFPVCSDQTWKQSCVWHSTATLWRYLLTHKIPMGKNWGDFDISEAFGWNMQRRDEGTLNLNTGCMLRNAFKILKVHGWVDKSYWDYPKGIYTEPDAKAQDAGEFFKLWMKYVGNYYALSTKEQIKNSLSNGYPVLFGMPVDDAYMSLNSDAHVVDSVGDIKGYHAQLIVGYTKEYVIVRNSWGTDWGDNGYSYLLWDFVENNCFDYWTMLK